jgi:hypothetical protein
VSSRRKKRDESAVHCTNGGSKLKLFYTGDGRSFSQPFGIAWPRGCEKTTQVKGGRGSKGGQKEEEEAKNRNAVDASTAVEPDKHSWSTRSSQRVHTPVLTADNWRKSSRNAHSPDSRTNLPHEERRAQEEELEGGTEGGNY